MKMFSNETFVIAYNAILYIAAACNLIFSGILLTRSFNKKYQQIPGLRRVNTVAAIALLVAGMDFFINAFFDIRVLCYPAAAIMDCFLIQTSAVMLTYCYAKIAAPELLTKRRIRGNIAFCIVCLMAYLYNVYYVIINIADVLTKGWADTYLSYGFFFAHMLYIAGCLTIIFLKDQRKSDDEKEHSRHISLTLVKSIPFIIVSIVAAVPIYILSENKLVIFTAAAFAAYFFTYYIYRALTRYARSFFYDSTMPNLTSKYRRILKYNSFCHIAVLGIAAGVSFITSEKTITSVESDTEYPKLNLTKHANWDNPDLDDLDLEKFVIFLYNNVDSTMARATTAVYMDSISYEETVAWKDTILNMKDFFLKGVLQIIAYDGCLSRMPHEQVKTELIHDYLDNTYKCAQGYYACPQLLFFDAWDKAMQAYTLLNETDSVKAEATKMLAICRQQNIPYGIIMAYENLANCLFHVHDYLGASSQYEIALDYYNKYYTEKFGKDWDDNELLSTNAIELKTKRFICHLEAGDSLWLKKNIGDMDRIMKEKPKTIDHNFNSRIYYSLASYHQLYGEEKQYERYIKEYGDYLKKWNILDKKDYENKLCRDMYYTALIRHHLRNNQPDEAIKYMNMMPETFCDSTTSYLPEALLLQGRYKEAAELFKATTGYYYSQLNGRNRNLLQSMASKLGDEDHQMQIMQEQLKNQQTRILYNTILIFIFLIMILGLAYFLFHQHRLNKKLSIAIEAEERARHTKDIFLKNMTHEFHTPLNTLQGFSQILADPDFPIDEESTREMGGEMVKAAEHMTRLLDNILEVTEKLSKLDHLEKVESIIKENTTEEL